MGMKKLKIVLDTNIWISQLFGGSVKLNFYKIISSDKIEIYVSEELKNEIFDVVNRPKIRNILKNNKAKDLGVLLNKRTKIVVPSITTDICRDPKDNFLLSLCHECDTNYLLTGDNDLLILKSFEKTKIISLSDFMKTYNKYL